jgi:hypothetical protein
VIKYNEKRQIDEKTYLKKDIIKPFTPTIVGVLNLDSVSSK